MAERKIARSCWDLNPKPESRSDLVPIPDINETGWQKSSRSFPAPRVSCCTFASVLISLAREAQESLNESSGAPRLNFVLATLRAQLW